MYATICKIDWYVLGMLDNCTVTQTWSFYNNPEMYNVCCVRKIYNNNLL